MTLVLHNWAIKGIGGLRANWPNVWDVCLVEEAEGAGAEERGGAGVGGRVSGDAEFLVEGVGGVADGFFGKVERGGDLGVAAALGREADDGELGFGVGAGLRKVELFQFFGEDG